MSTYYHMTVRYLIDERQKQSLKELLPGWRQWTTEDGKQPYAKYTQEELIQMVFEAIMTVGSTHDINSRIKKEQYRQGIIDIDEYMNEEPFRLKSEITGAKQSGLAETSGTEHKKPKSR